MGFSPPFPSRPSNSLRTPCVLNSEEFDGVRFPFYLRIIFMYKPRDTVFYPHMVSLLDFPRSYVRISRHLQRSFPVLALLFAFVPISWEVSSGCCRFLVGFVGGEFLNEYSDLFCCTRVFVLFAFSWCGRLCFESLVVQLWIKRSGLSAAFFCFVFRNRWAVH